jgi:Tfp pilus assembly protein PilF
MLRDWIRTDSNAAAPHNSLGTYYYGQRKHAEAKAEFEQALRIDSSNVQSRFNLGLCYGHLGDMRASVVLFRQVAEQAPNSSEGKRAQRLLDEITRQMPAGPKR